MHGKRIKHFRNQKGMSQTDLAKKVGLGTSQISMIEANKRTTSVEKLTKIADALGVKVIELYDDEAQQDKTSLEGGEQGWMLFNEEMKGKGYTPEELKKWIKVVEELRKNNNE